MAYRRLNHKAGMFYKKDYEYDPDTNTYQCPQRQPLIYKTTKQEKVIITINLTPWNEYRAQR